MTFPVKSRSCSGWLGWGTAYCGVPDSLSNPLHKIITGDWLRWWCPMREFFRICANVDAYARIIPGPSSSRRGCSGRRRTGAPLSGLMFASWNNNGRLPLRCCGSLPQSLCGLDRVLGWGQSSSGCGIHWNSSLCFSIGLEELVQEEDGVGEDEKRLRSTGGLATLAPPGAAKGGSNGDGYYEGSKQTRRRTVTHCPVGLRQLSVGRSSL